VIASRYFNLQVPAGGVHARYNITPGVQITSVHATAESPAVFGFSSWGFHPPWAKADAPTPINIRAEKAATSAYFRSAFAHRRCLIPANGWYEWRRTESGKQPYYITLKDPEDDEVVFLAGLWEPVGEGAETCCAILTEPVSPEFAFIHERQPVVLDPDAGGSGWTRNWRTGRRSARLRDGWIQIGLQPIRCRHGVNRPANDDPGLLEPSDDSGP
jgi:putative SOS response-associated peptidase YedK